MSPTSTNRLTTAIGTLLLVEGISGMVKPLVFGFLTTNRLHAGIQLVFALWALKAAFTTGARSFLFAFAVISILVAALYFIPGGRVWTDYLALNRAGASLKAALGIVALVCAAKCGR